MAVLNVGTPCLMCRNKKFIPSCTLKCFKKHHNLNITLKRLILYYPINNKSFRTSNFSSRCVFSSRLKITLGNENHSEADTHLLLLPFSSKVTTSSPVGVFLIGREPFLQHITGLGLETPIFFRNMFYDNQPPIGLKFYVWIKTEISRVRFRK